MGVCLVAAQLRQLAILGPGSQGLSSELSPFQQSIEFALKADNCVVDRIGRLAAREAFADYASENNFALEEGEQFDVVRIVTLEPEEIAPQDLVPANPEPDLYGFDARYSLARYNYDGSQSINPETYSVAKYGVGRYGLDLYALDSNADSQPNLTFCLIGIGRPAISSREYALYGKSKYGSDRYFGNDLVFTSINRYVGAVLEDGKLKAIDEITPNHGVTNAQLVPFRSSVYVFSKGDPVMVYGNTLYGGNAALKLSDFPGYTPPQDDNGIIANEIDGDIACAAYGRLWVSGVNNDYDTIYYSSLLRPEQWYDGKANPDDDGNTAGIIDVREYWPTGNDRIKGIAAHNGFLIIFGRHSILIYSGAQGDPAGENGLQLQDAIRDVGLVNQDAMCNIGTDHLFVDSIGVRALGRVIQEKSSPIAELSLNVATVIREEIEMSRDTVRLVHLPSKSKAVCLFPSTQTAYCFQLGQPSVTGGLKTTHWDGCYFWDSATVRNDYKDLELLGGRNERGVLLYDGYKQAFSYKMSYESSVLLPGESLMKSMIPKSMFYSYHSDREIPFTARWGFGSEQFTYSAAVSSPYKVNEFKTVKVNAAGSGEMLRVGFDVQIQNEKFSMQQISINALVGRVIV
jgi:hypothetical protein